jgi:hypothetical protein
MMIFAAVLLPSLLVKQLLETSLAQLELLVQLLLVLAQVLRSHAATLLLTATVI